MRPVYAFALHTPAERISDFFRYADEAPPPRKWGGYRAADTEVLRAYCGDMTVTARRIFFSLALPGAHGADHALRTGAQAKFRAKWLADHILDMMADVPSQSPAD